MKYLLCLLLLVPSLSYSFVEFNYNRIANLCPGFISFVLYDDGPVPLPSFVNLPYGAPLIGPIVGTAESIIWNTIIFPIPGHKLAPYRQDCYFHNCTLTPTSARIRMACVEPPIIGGAFISTSDDFNLELEIEVD